MDMKQKRMITFPLYDTLTKRRLRKTAINAADRKTLCERLANMNRNDYEYLYVLIKTYELNEEEGPPTLEIPYSGYANETGTYFEISKLPGKLQHLILRFSEMAANRTSPHVQGELEIQFQSKG